MKKSIIALVLIFFCGLFCYAKQFEYDIKVGKLYYKIETTGDLVYAKVLGGSPSMAGSLSKVIIPSTITYQDQTVPVTRIDIYAFSQEINLTDITIPSSIVKIGHDAFLNCDKLENVYVEDLTSWLTLSMGDNPLKQAKKLYVNNNLVYDIIIPNGITTMPGDCFYTFPGITSIKCPSTVTSIGNQCFYSCPNLSSVQLGDSVETIGNKAFYDCRALIAIDFPSTLTTIQDYAFFSCRQLQEITIPASTITIGDNAFGYCTNLTTITSMNKRPLVIPLTTFSTEIYKSATLRVPAGTKSKYQQTAGWSQFTNIEEMDPIIDVTYSSGGSIVLNNKDIEESPTTCTIPLKSDLKLQLFPEARKCLGSLSINGANKRKDVSMDGEIIVGQVAEDLDIQVSFVDACSMSLSSTNGGYLTIDDYDKNVNMIWLPKSSKHDVHILTEKGFRLKQLFLNGTDVIDKLTPTGVLKIQKLEEDISIQAVFEKIWEVSCEYTEGGSMLINDNMVNSIIAVDGDDVKLTINPNTGYHLLSVYMNDNEVTNKWQDGSLIIKDVHNDLHFIVAFMKNTYIITYIVDDEDYKTEAVLFATKIKPEPIPEKEGYTFSGWSEIPDSMPANDVTITGKFTINSYKLTYIVDGAEYKSFDIKYGSTIIAEEELEKEGYTFSGWSEIPETMPARDVMITGSFSVNKYLLAYIVDDETYKTDSIAYGTKLTAEEVPEKDGYTFSGWSEIPDSMPAKDVTVTGAFIINSYKLTYLLNGEVYKSDSIVYATPLSAEPAIEQEGYTFSGWSGVPITMPAKDVTITGSFTVNSYKLTYMVDGEEHRSFDLNYGSAIIAEEEPEKEGYTFSGWSEIPDSMPARDVTIMGAFTINSYKLTYLLNGEVYKSDSIVYATPLIAEPAIEQEGYTFSGWSEIPDSMPARDVTITGKFTINSYKLMYMVDGEEYKSFNIKYGYIVIAEEEPEKEGYTFNGWSEIPEEMPARDVTITGTFTVNKYKVQYYVGEQLWAEDEVEYGAKLTLRDYTPEDTNRYSFAGWDGEMFETMPAKDIEYRAMIVDGISGLNADANGIEAIYDGTGRKLSKMQRGVNVLRMKDGTTRKVFR